MKRFSLWLALIVLLSPYIMEIKSARAEIVRSIVFPVIGTTSFSNDFGDPRSGGRTHEGNDIMGKKMMPLIAAADGTISFIAVPEESWGNAIHIRDKDGYSYRYLHINDDIPGTDNGLGGPMFAYAPDMTRGNSVVKGQLIGWMGDSGNAENATPHLHFEIHSPDGAAINPYESLKAANHISAPAIPPALLGETLPYDNLILGTSIAAENFDSDSDIEFVTGAGQGGGPHIRTFDPKNSAQNTGASFYAYFSDFYGGVDVAAGDIDNDGIDEIITGAGVGGGPHVKIFKANGTLIAGFYAYHPGFLGGIRVAAADIDGDNKAEIITGAGQGGGPHVRIFKADGTAISSFFAFDSNFIGGIDVAAAPSYGGTAASIIVGRGSDIPQVRVFDISGTMRHAFSAYDSGFLGGVRVSVADVDKSNNSYEIITAPASAGGPNYRMFSFEGTTLKETNMFDSWWMGSFDVGAKNGTIFAATGGKGFSGPIGRRASVREIDWSFNEPNWWNKDYNWWSQD